MPDGPLPCQTLLWVPRWAVPEPTTFPSARPLPQWIEEHLQECVKHVETCLFACVIFLQQSPVAIRGDGNGDGDDHR